MFGGTSVPLWRRLAAGLGGLASAVVLLQWVGGHDRYKIAPPVVALVVAALAVHVPRLGAQVFARASWWASLGLGELIALLDSGDKNKSLAYLVPSAFALLVIGRRGLAEAEEKSGQAASAFRSSLLLLMVLALADAQTFTVFGLISLDGLDGERVIGGEAALLFGAALSLVVGFVGLFRLALWGALSNLLTCAVVFVASVGGLGGHDTRRMALLVLSGLHVVVATPVIVATVTKRRLPSLPPALRAIGVNVAVVGLVAIAAASVVLR